MLSDEGFNVAEEERKGAGERQKKAEELKKAEEGWKEAEEGSPGRSRRGKYASKK